LFANGVNKMSPAPVLATLDDTKGVILTEEFLREKVKVKKNLDPKTRREIEDLYVADLVSEVYFRGHQISGFEWAPDLTLQDILECVKPSRAVLVAKAVILPEKGYCCIYCGMKGEPLHAAGFWRGKRESGAFIRVRDIILRIEGFADESWRVTRVARRDLSIEEIPWDAGVGNTEKAGVLQYAVRAAIVSAQGGCDRYAMNNGRPIDRYSVAGGRK